MPRTDGEFVGVDTRKPWREAGRRALAVLQDGGFSTLWDVLVWLRTRKHERRRVRGFGPEAEGRLGDVLCRYYLAHPDVAAAVERDWRTI